MATTTFTYATQQNLIDYFPNISSGDSKRPVYNWVASVSNEIDGLIDMYYSNDTGLVDQLFADGHKVLMTAFNTTATTTLDEDETDNSTSISVADESAFAADDIIKINDEYMIVNATSSGVISVSDRGIFGTSITSHSSGNNVYKIMDAGDYATDDGDNELNFFHAVYDTDLDKVLLLATTDPNDILMEAGSDFKTIVNRQLYRASMELNNMLDNRFPNPIPKNFIHSDTPSSDTAEYDAILVKLSCYITASNMLRASGDWEQAELIQNEITNTEETGMVDKLNKGEWKLSFETDKTDSSGDIIEVTNAGSMNLVETYGGWNGIKYDRIQMICTTGGAYGTAKMTIKVSNGTNLYGAEITDWTVTGGLDHVSNGLYARFEGNSMNTNDRWDIEVRNYAMKQTNAQGTRSVDAIRNDLKPSKVQQHKLGVF